MPDFPFKSVSDTLRRVLRVPYADTDPITQCGPDFTQPNIEKFAQEARQFAYEKLYATPYKDVPACWRRLYEEAGCWVAVDALEAAAKKHGTSDGWIDELVRILDMVIIMVGAPRRKTAIDNVFAQLDAHLQARRREKDHEFASRMTFDEYDDWYQHDGKPHSPKRRRLSSNPTRFYLADPEPTVPDTFPASASARPPLRHPLRRFENLSLAAFQAQLDADSAANGGQGGLPFIVTGALQHWPALRERPWSNPKYLLSRTLGGRRLVPVETGRSYTAAGWGQRIMTFRGFLDAYMLRSGARRGDVNGGPAPAEGEEAERMPDIAYLAQHDLLSQIPALRADIAVLDYCYTTPPSPHLTPRDLRRESRLSDAEADPFSPSPAPSPSQTPTDADAGAEAVAINAWFGPARTTSPLHTDPHHNILAQVVGAKYVRLCAPTERERLYPMGAVRGVGPAEGVDIDMGNTSRVDVGRAMGVWEGWWGFVEEDEHEDGDEDDAAGKQQDENERFRAEFPSFPDAAFVEGVLGPGDCVFIPRGWWHYVRALSPSFSVSFWWD